MTNVVELKRKAEALEKGIALRHLVKDGGTPPPPPPDMETRVAKLESLAEKTGDRLTAIERDVAVIKATHATKDDLTNVYKAINDQTWKLIGWTTGLGTALVAITYFIARTVK